MSQRRAGVALLLAAALSALVLPGVFGHAVSGSPAAAADPPPPATGACVVKPVRDDQRIPFVLDGGTPLSLPTAAFGPCGPSTFGEVTGIYLTSGPGPVTVSATVHAIDRCSVDGLRYLGVTVALTNSTDTTGHTIEWEPVIGSAVVAVGPTARERAAGHAWVACVVRAADERPFPASVREALAGAGLPWDVLSCGDGPGSTTSSCRGAHQAQLLGTTVVNPAGPLTDADLLGSCTTLAAGLIGSPDPTAKSLVPRVIKDSLMHAYVSCTLTAPAGTSLTASVISLGDAAAPFGR